MCHHLWLGTPLTLSEVRAMLPDGFSADAADDEPRRRLSALADQTRTVVALRLGGCACALYLEPAGASQSTESALRARYFRQGIPRATVISALDRHRAAGKSPMPPVEARRAFAEFVAEHARNAGTALFLRTYHPEGVLPADGADAIAPRSIADVRTTPCEWLPEDQPVLVGR